MDIVRAAEVFVAAFCAGKSQFHPYIPVRYDGFWVMADGPGRREPRAIEVVSVTSGPTKTVRAIEKMEIGHHFVAAISEFGADTQAIKAEFKSLGYRLMKTEILYTHSLRSIPEFHAEPPVRMVTTAEEMASIPIEARQKRRFDPGNRYFCSWDSTRDYGWVTSMPVGDDAWVSGLYVREAYRGKGIGKALMSALLKEDRRQGVGQSVLLSSKAGTRVYPVLGYEQIGQLQLFCLG